MQDIKRNLLFVLLCTVVFVALSEKLKKILRK